MKKLLMATLAIIAIACTPKIEHKVYNQGINIIPVPASLTQGEGRFTITSSTVIVVANPELANVSAYLGAKIKASTGYDLAIAKENPQANYIALNIAPELTVGQEGYTLVSTAENVKIEARTAQGAFYAMQTLLQLLPAEIESPNKIDYIEWTLPAVTIKDEPRFAHRGIMLDPCRHFLSVEYIKKQLDVLSMFKLNRFHWHLTDDQGWRIEIKKYPKLTEMGAVRTEGDGSTYGPFFYTQEQAKEIVAYAAERFIEVIAEVELPGHGMAALSGYPEYSCTGGPFTPRIIWGVEDEVYCVGKDSTFTFWTDVIDEVSALFPSKYFHIGGDECPKIRWKECPTCQARAKALGLKEKVDANGVKHTVEEQLQSYAVTRIEKHVASKGKHMIGWDEILEGGLADGAIVMSWRGNEGGIAAANMNHQVIMCPNPEGLYLDHFQGAPELEPMTIGGYSTLSTVYSYDPIPAALPVDKQQYVLGVQGNIWAEYIHTEPHNEYMIYPRILAVAEVGWSPLSVKDYDKFAKRVDNAYVRLDFHNINYHIPLPEGVVTKNVVIVDAPVKVGFNNTRNYTMVYTLDGSEPTTKSTIYSDSIILSEPTTIKIATMLPSEKLSRTVTIAVEKQSLKKGEVEPSKEIKAKVAKGLFITKEQYANAQFGADTTVSKLNGGIVYQMNTPSLTIYEGTFDVPEDGAYSFTSDIDELYVDGDLVIDNNSPKLARHGVNKVQKALAAGTHSYKIVYNNMIKAGWPATWNEIGFRYQLPSGGQWVNPYAVVEETKK